jgi:hypothetical protein
MKLIFFTVIPAMSTATARAVPSFDTMTLFCVKSFGSLVFPRTVMDGVADTVMAG